MSFCPLNLKKIAVSESPIAFFASGRRKDGESQMVCYAGGICMGANSTHVIKLH